MPITVVTGPPGAGKTTVSSALALSSERSVHLEVDQCLHWIVSGYISPWSAASHRQNGTVIEAVGAASSHFAVGGYDVVVDGIVGPWFLDRLQRVAGPGAEAFHYVILRPTRETAHQRAVGRRGAHDLVDARAIDAVYNAFCHLASFETNVVDSSYQEKTDTVATVHRGMEVGRFAVTDRHRRDMARLALKYDERARDVPGTLL